MSYADDQYLDLVGRIVTTGVAKPSRAGETIGVFGHMLKFDLTKGFPLLTTKTINLESVYHELMWFLRGDQSINTLKAPQLWAPWADQYGECGPIYGKQWVRWSGSSEACGNYMEVNQVQQLIDKLINSPNDRRMLVSAWNVLDIPSMALPPCHVLFQCYTTPDGYVDMTMYQRSCDTAIGIPYNIASYALLLKMLADECNLIPRHLIMMLGDVHIYTHHLEKIKKQMMRQPKPAPELALSAMDFWERAERDNPKEDYILSGYNPHGFMKYDLNI